MITQARVYLNTGFNNSNIPDNPDLLNQCQFIDLPVMDLVQNRNLSNLKLKTTWEDIKNADYLRLQTANEYWYYIIQDIQMLATDVASLTVITDYINSAGGVQVLNIIDGITERVHVSNDSYGAWTSEDSLLTPSEPLGVTAVWCGYGNSSTEPDAVIYESTVNPITTYEAQNGKTYSDENDNIVTVPEVLENETQTEYTVAGMKTQQNPGTCCYYVKYGDSYEGQTDKALANLRALGIEQCIINEVRMSSDFVEIKSKINQSKHITPPFAYSYIGEINGKDSTKTVDVDLAFSPYSVQNNRINYSNILKYGIITCSGEQAEYEPASLYDGNTVPSIRCISDPHLDGKPYYRYKTVNGDSSIDGFWRNCISGMQWKKVPLIYYGASGSLLNTQKIVNEQKISLLGYDEIELQQKQSDINALNSMLKMGASLFSMKPEDIGPAIAGNIFGMELSNLQYDRLNLASQRLESSLSSELYNLNVTNKVVVPTINFPYNSEILLDYFNNDCMVYRYNYSDTDVRRIDRLLTMYGYKVTKQLETSDFTNREHFNFVQCSNITVSNGPSWLNDGIAGQLRNGVRVWHNLVDVNNYNSNPIRSEE